MCYNGGTKAKEDNTQMKIKIDFLKKTLKDIEQKKNALANLLDTFDATADEQDIAELAEMLRYYADLVESIPIN